MSKTILNLMSKTVSDSVLVQIANIKTDWLEASIYGLPTQAHHQHLDSYIILLCFTTESNSVRKM